MKAAVRFNMEGYIPYGWQPKGAYIHITPSKTKGTQVFGLMNLDNQLQAYSCQGSINSDIVIAFIDDFCKTIKQRTVIILDNASIHCSEAFLKKQQEWKVQDLYIFHLPKYSPHLNPIEILWRKIKYEWLQYEFIDNQDQLNEELERILNAFGTEYNINFKNQKVSNIFT